MSRIDPGRSECYCINFRRAANTLTRYYDEGFAGINVTANQFFLLNSIHQLEPCNKSGLAGYTRLDRTTIIRNLDILLKKGLIEEVPGKTNRNRVTRLTGKGNRSLKEGREIWERLQSEIKQRLGDDNISVLWDVFASIEASEHE